MIKKLEADFGAIVTPGVDLAFADSVTKKLAGSTIMQEDAEREIRVCGPGAYIVLKALAFKNRGYSKDAFDLYYVLRYYAGGVSDIASRIVAFGDRPEVSQAIDVLQSDFTDPRATGPTRVAEFLGLPSAGIRQDVVGFVVELLAGLDIQ